MLRIHFGSADLSRTRVAPDFNPFWEMVFSRLRLTEPNPPVVLHPWLDRTRPQRGRLEPGVRVLTALSPLGPYFPDFITPPEGLRGFDAGLQAIMRTPQRRLGHELGKLAESSMVPSWGRHLADGRTAVLTRLAGILRTYHAVAIEPHADLIRARVQAEHTRRARDLHSGGADALLRGMAPLMRWRPPVLEMSYAVDRDMHLEGRGLLLVPSFFCRHDPVALVDPDLPPTLVYPIDPRSHWQATPDASLVALLGATRATVLAAIGSGTTTTDLARRADTSPASASRHTQILREAGLIHTTRDGTAVLHTLTPLGLALLEGAMSTIST